jgi:hypothetical protein
MKKIIIQQNQYHHKKWTQLNKYNNKKINLLNK